MRVNKKHKIVVTESDRYSEAALQIYRKLGEIILCQHAREALCERDATILVIRLTHYIGKEWLDAFPSLEVIASPTTGLNHIDTLACEERGIQVISLKGEHEFLRAITSTAEHTLGLILALLRSVPTAHQAVTKRHEWCRDNYVSTQLSSLTLGLIGYGRIGKQMHHIGERLAGTIRIYDPYVTGEDRADSDIFCDSLEELLQQSDIVSIHADYRHKNHHLVDAVALASMKPGTYLINTARGELLDEQATVKALLEGRLAGVAVDVLEDEQFSRHIIESPLIEYAQTHNNVIITPHIAGCTRDAMSATEEFVAKRVFEVVGA